MKIPNITPPKNAKTNHAQLTILHPPVLIYCDLYMTALITLMAYTYAPVLFGCVPSRVNVSI